MIRNVQAHPAFAEIPVSRWISAFRRASGKASHITSGVLTTSQLADVNTVPNRVLGSNTHFTDNATPPHQIAAAIIFEVQTKMYLR